MDWTTYIATLQAQVGLMQSSDDYSIDFEIYPGMLLEDIDAIEGYLHLEPGMEDVSIPDELRAFYRVTSGFSLYWYSERERENPWKLVRRGDDDVNVSYGAPGGHTYILLLSQMYTPVERHQAGERNIPFASLFEDYRTFDLIGGDRVCTRFYRDRQEPAFFYYHQETNNYYSLTLDFTSYMGTLLEARALKGWQQFFIADPAYKVESAWVEWFHESLVQLFPDADVTRFRR